MSPREGVRSSTFCTSSGFKVRWCRGTNHGQCDRGRGCAATASSLDVRNFWFGKLRRITKFADDLDDRALAAFGCNFWSRQQIDSFLLIQRTNDELKLRISKNAGESKNS